MNRGRGLNRGRGRGSRTPAHIRHSVAVTTTRLNCRENPPNCEQGAQWRRTIQKQVSSPNNSTSNFVQSADDFFDSAFNTTGFDKIFLHKVSVWSGAHDAQTNAPVISIALLAPSGSSQYVSPTYKDYASQSNRRAGISFAIPSHLSGPYMSGNQMLLLSGDTSYVVEIDATFV